MLQEPGVQIAKAFISTEESSTQLGRAAKRPGRHLFELTGEDGRAEAWNGLDGVFCRLEGWIATSLETPQLQCGNQELRKSTFPLLREPGPSRRDHRH